MIAEVERKEAQLQEKREQVLQAKSGVDRVMGELTGAQQSIDSLQSQLEMANVSLGWGSC